ncbi:MAG TPA: ROK family protein [Polyangiaceae bacterium]|nr:ROK family protein [Polyangiaceae bacterium]
MIGVDIGGTKIKIALVEGARIVAEESVDTPVGQPPSVLLDLVASTVNGLSPKPRTIGVAIPGEVNRSGRCYRLPNIPGFEGIPIATELEKRTGARVAVENDATTAALAEALYGHGRDHESFLTVTLGTGVGGGVVLLRRLIRGVHGFAGEIGHVIVDSSDGARTCGCGNRGCLEAYAGIRGILETFRAAGGAGTDVVAVAESARRGEAAGLAAFADLSRVLGIALTSIQNLLDLDAIVFTGGVSGAFDLIAPRLREELRKRRYAEPLSEVLLLRSELGEKAGVVGAAHLG